MHPDDVELTIATAADLHEVWKAFTADDVRHLWPWRSDEINVDDLLALSGSVHVVRDPRVGVIATLQVCLDTLGIWVRSDYRRRGIATKLVRMLIKREPSASWIVWGRSENEAGRRLFARLGFSHWHDDDEIFECRHDPSGELGELLYAMKKYLSQNQPASLSHQF